MRSEERKVLNDRLAHLEDTLCDYDKSAIRAGAATVLKMTSSYPGETLHTDGHCDERVRLGGKRAQAVTEFFEMTGISSPQPTVINFGKDKPVCSVQSENCWRKNRRTHIVAQK